MPWLHLAKKTQEHEERSSTTIHVKLRHWKEGRKEEGGLSWRRRIPKARWSDANPVWVCACLLPVVCMWVIYPLMKKEGEKKNKDHGMCRPIGYFGSLFYVCVLCYLGGQKTGPLDQDQEQQWACLWEGEREGRVMIIHKTEGQHSAKQQETLSFFPLMPSLIVLIVWAFYPFPPLLVSLGERVVEISEVFRVIITFVIISCAEKPFHFFFFFAQEKLGNVWGPSFLFYFSLLPDTWDFYLRALCVFLSLRCIFWCSSLMDRAKDLRSDLSDTHPHRTHPLGLRRKMKQQVTKRALSIHLQLCYLFYGLTGLIKNMPLVGWPFFWSSCKALLLAGPSLFLVPHAFAFAIIFTHTHTHISSQKNKSQAQGILSRHEKKCAVVYIIIFCLVSARATSIRAASLIGWLLRCCALSRMRRPIPTSHTPHNYKEKG